MIQQSQVVTSGRVAACVSQARPFIAHLNAHEDLIDLKNKLAIRQVKVDTSGFRDID